MAEVVNLGVVVHDQTAATKATVLEADQDTISDQLVRDLDHLVQDITSDRRSEDVKGITNPTGSEPVESVKKKRKASATDFAPAHFKIKTKKTTKYVYMKVFVSPVF